MPAACGTREGGGAPVDWTLAGAQRWEPGVRQCPPCPGVHTSSRMTTKDKRPQSKEPPAREPPKKVPPVQDPAQRRAPVDAPPAPDEDRPEPPVEDPGSGGTPVKEPGKPPAMKA